MNKKKCFILLMLLCFVTNTIPLYRMSVVKALDEQYTLTNEIGNEQVNQKWKVSKVATENAVDYYSIINDYSGKAITGSNTSVVLEDYSINNQSQLWEITMVDAANKHYSVKNKYNGKYLSLANGLETAPGQSLILTDIVGPGHTLFQFSWTTIVSGNKYNILSVWPIFRLQGNGAAPVNDFPIQANIANGQTNQKWKVDKISTINLVDYFTITNTNTGKIISYTNNIFTQKDYISGDDTQLWSITPGGDGNVGLVIKNKQTDGNIILSNTTSNNPGNLSISPFDPDPRWHYNTNGYGLWLFDGGLTINSGSVYTIRSYAPQFCIQGDGAASSNDFPVVSVASSGQTNQKWTITKIMTDGAVDYYSIRNDNTGKVISLSNEIVTQEDYLAGNDAQLWGLEMYDPTNFYYTIKNKFNNKYLSLAGGVNTTDGQALTMTDFAGAGHTLFQFSWTTVSDGGKYNILSVWPIFCLQGNGSVIKEDLSVSANIASGQINQKWKIDKIATVDMVDYYTLTNMGTNMVLFYNGSNFSQENYLAGNDAQLWSITPGGDGNVGLVIKNKQTDGNIILKNTTTNNPGDISLSPYDPDPRWHYNTNGYGLWLLNGGLTFTSGNICTIRSYSPSFYMQSTKSGNEPVDEESTINLDLRTNKNDQKWVFNSVKIGENTYYKITSYYTNKILTATLLNNVIEKDSMAVDEVESDMQLWTLDVTTSGQYQGYAIISKYNGFCISAQGGDLSVAKEKTILTPIESRTLGASMWLLNKQLSIRDGAPQNLSLVWPSSLYLTSFGTEFIRPQVPIGDERYYVSSSVGNDGNNGLSELTPIKTIAKLNTIALKAGNKIFLKKGDKFTDGLTINGKGSVENWITISGYGDSGKNPTISVQKDIKGIFIYNTAFIEISGIDVEAALEVQSGPTNNQQAMSLSSEGAGIQAVLTTNIRILNCNVKASRNSSAGISVTDSINPEIIDKTNIYIDNCTVDGAVMGVGITQSNQFTIVNTTAINCHAWGMASVLSDDGLFYNCTTDNIGFGENKYGNCAMMSAWSHRIDFDHCYMYNTQRGPQLYDGCGFDFEGGGNDQSDIRLMNSIIDGVDGCGIFIFNNMQSGGTKNFLVSNVIVKNYGRNYGNTKEGIYFANGNSQVHSSGAVINSVFINEGSYDFYNDYPNDVNNVSFVSNNFMFIAVKEDLRNYIEIESQRQRSNETDIVWNEIQKALINAKNVYNNPSSTDKQISDAILLLLIPRIEYGTYDQVNAYKLGSIKLIDYTTQNIDPSNTAAVTPAPVDSVPLNGIYENMTKEIIDTLIANTTTSIVTINVKKADIISAVILKALKDAGKTLKINIVDNDGKILFVWIFDTIEDVSNDIDLSLNEISSNKDKILKLINDKTSQIISFKNLKNLPGKTRIIVYNTQGFKSSDKINLYSFNIQSGTLESMTERVSISKDEKYLAFEIRQNTEYVISSFVQADATVPVITTNAINAGFVIIIICVIVAALAAGGIAFFVLIKKKKIPQTKN